MICEKFPGSLTSNAMALTQARREHGPQPQSSAAECHTTESGMTSRLSAREKRASGSSPIAHRICHAHHFIDVTNVLVLARNHRERGPPPQIAAAKRHTLYWVAHRVRAGTISTRAAPVTRIEFVLCIVNHNCTDSNSLRARAAAAEDSGRVPHH